MTASPRRSHTETGRAATAGGTASHWPPRRPKDGSARQLDGGARPEGRGGATRLDGGRFAHHPRPAPRRRTCSRPQPPAPAGAAGPSSVPRRCPPRTQPAACGGRGRGGESPYDRRVLVLSLAIHCSPGGRHTRREGRRGEGGEHRRISPRLSARLPRAPPPPERSFRTCVCAGLPPHSHTHACVRQLSSHTHARHRLPPPHPPPPTWCVSARLRVPPRPLPARHRFAPPPRNAGSRRVRVPPSPYNAAPTGARLLPPPAAAVDVRRGNAT